MEERNQGDEMAGTSEIAEAAGVDAGLAKRFLEEVIDRVMGGERVTLRGLGTFTLKTLPARTFHTALMSEPVTKPERDTIVFKPSTLAIEKLNK